MTAADFAGGPPLDAVRPWPGLDAFTEDQRGFFFGRDTEASELFRRVRRDPVTLLFGQSGLGKTSLLHAGLFPQLRAAGLLPIPLRIDYSDTAAPPTAQIEAAVDRAAGGEAFDLPPAAVERSLWAFFHRIDRQFVNSSGAAVAPVLVFDQFEEIFTLGLAREASRAASQNFLLELADLIENRPPEALERAIEADAEIIERYRFDRQDYRVVIAVREDFLAPLESLRTRAPLIGRNRFRLRPMSGRQGLEAVMRPAPGLIAVEAAHEIVRFVGRANPEDAFGESAADPASGIEIEPALLSLVCRELNERRLARGLHHITADLLAGSRTGIIQSFYEDGLADQPAGLRDFVEDELLGDSGFRESMSLERARRILARREVPPDALDTLVRRRLLRVEERHDISRVEIVHDVLTPIIRDSRDTRRVRQAELAATEREAALRRERRRTRLAYGAATVMAVLLIATVMLGWWAYRSSVEAEQQRAAATAARERAEHNLAVATETANGLVFDLARKFRNSGVAADVIADIIGRARRLQEQLTAGGETSPALRRSEAAALLETADSLLTAGQTQGALAAAEQGGDIFQSLVAFAPDNTDYQRDLAVSRDKVGDALRAQDDLAGALAAYRDSVAITRTLLQKEPANALWQHDLSASDNRIGDVLLAQGDRVAALLQYRQALGIVAQLANSDPGNTERQRDLALSNMRVGDVLQAQNDLPGALVAYREAFAVIAALAKRDPGNTEWQRDLAASDAEIANVLQAQGDIAGALALSRDSIAIRRAVEQKDPANPERRHDLAVALGEMSWLLLLDKQPQDALTNALEALALAPSLLPVEINRAHALLLLGRFDEAKAIYLANKDKRVGGRTFGDAVREDFAQLRKVGIVTPDMERIEDLLAP